MFILATIADTVRVAPSQFSLNLEDVIRDEIDAKYGAHVVIDVGLCLSTVQLVHIGDGLVYPLDGSATYHTTFQQLVFRPFLDEIIVGTIVGSTGEGLVVSLEFFEGLTIPAKNLPKPSTYDEAARLWTWRYEGTEFHLDSGLEMRVRVKKVEFTKVRAHKTGLQATTTVTEARDDAPKNVRCRSSSVDLDSAAPLPSAMHIIGAINEQGLGPVDWWPDDEDEDDNMNTTS